MLSGRTAGSESAFDLVYFLERVFLFFFFSSRRRHTRYWRDWSSDVCSSDLAHLDDGGEEAPGSGRSRGRGRGTAGQPGGPRGRHRGNRTARRLHARGGCGGLRHPGRLGGSEERRVGEGGRSRWSPYPLKKKK